MLNHPTGLFSEDYNSALRGCWPLKFLHSLQLPKCISSLTWGAGRPHIGLCPIFLVYFDIENIDWHPYCSFAEYFV